MISMEQFKIVVRDKKNDLVQCTNYSYDFIFKRSTITAFLRIVYFVLSFLVILALPFSLLIVETTERDES